VRSIDGETMGTAASPFLNPIAAEQESVSPKRTAQALSLRARRRRQIQGMIAASYLVDALVLETGFTERFKDHYFVAPQLIVSTAILLAFAYIAPEVGMMFLCTLFVVFNFGSLRSTPRQTAIFWTAMALGLAGLFLLTDKLSLCRTVPISNALQRCRCSS
jgi:diguanylate cyclase